MRKLNRLPYNFILVAIVLIYLLLAIYQIDLPGLHYDEAFEAVPALQLLNGQPVAAFRESGLTIGGQMFPVMTQDYIGTLNTYLAIPFIAALGPTPAALRTMSIITGIITLLLSYLLAYQLTAKRWVGLVVMLLLAVDPTFIFWNRQGVFVTAITAPIGLGATYCWLRRLHNGSIRWSLVGSFLFGLGLYAKFLFLWLIVALIGAFFLIILFDLIKQQRPSIRLLPLSPTEMAGLAAAFLIGCWPLVLYNLQTGGTILSIRQNASTSYYGIDNLAFGSNLLVRLDQISILLQGSHFWYLGDIYENFWAPIFFGVVFVMVGLFATRSCLDDNSNYRSLSPAQTALFSFLVIGLVTLASIGTVSALWITHFAILMPWPALAAGVGSWYILKSITTSPESGRISKFYRLSTIIYRLVITGLIIWVITSLTTTIRYHRSLATSGGLSSHSDAIYDMSHWLTGSATGPSEAAPAVVAMDWGLSAPISYLTGGQVTPVEIFGYGWQADIQLDQRLAPYIDQPATLYLWRAPDEIIFDRSGEFKLLYRPHKLKEAIEEAFYERSGRPILGVTRLVECGTSGVISPEPAEHCR